MIVGDGVVCPKVGVDLLGSLSQGSLPYWVICLLETIVFPVLLEHLVNLFGILYECVIIIHQGFLGDAFHSDSGNLAVVGLDDKWVVHFSDSLTELFHVLLDSLRVNPDVVTQEHLSEADHPYVDRTFLSFTDE